MKMFIWHITTQFVVEGHISVSGDTKFTARKSS